MTRRTISRLIQSFCAGRDGNVAVIFALSSIPILFLLGAGVDFSRASTQSSKVQADIDATALALCKSTTTAVAELRQTAQTMLAAYSPTYPITIDALDVTANPRTITLAGHITYPTTLSQVMNVPTVNVGASATCTVGEIYYEIALVLDTTGSMANSAGGVSKISALRSAATNFVNQMFSSIDSKYLKISIVPFAASVKVDPVANANATWLDTQGKSQFHWQNVKNASGSGFTSRLDIFRKLASVNASWAWAGCLESLPYPLNVQDGAPITTNPDSYYVPLFAPDEVGNSGQYSYTVGNNSYLDDGISTNNASCDSDTDSKTRMGQACKYASPKNIRTSQEGPNWMCTSRALTRLTNTKTTLLNEISQLQASGNTDIHEGLMWGWRTVSPLSVFADGAPYQSPTQRTVKIIVLMTDGMNTWTGDSNNPVTGSYYSAYGYFNNANTPAKPNDRLPTLNANPSTSDQARAAMDALTAQACTNTKAAGITIYSVGFSGSTDPIDTAGQTLLQNCASQTGNYFLASNSTALNNAFSSIAQGIGQLRLTH